MSLFLLKQKRTQKHSQSTRCCLRRYKPVEVFMENDRIRLVSPSTEQAEKILEAVLKITDSIKK